MNALAAVGIGAMLIFVAIPALMRRWVRPDISLSPRHWGRVYIFQDVRSPSLLKVGFTGREIWRRRGEVSADMTGGRELRCLHSVHMPYAASVESEAHRLLAKHREWSERGREWFRISRQETAIRAVDRAARTVRRVAKLRRGWSAEAEQDYLMEPRRDRR